jgi:hypothetical protein
MKKIFLIIIVVISLMIVIANSGCIENNKVNKTWGEKKISMNAIEVSNKTVGNRSLKNNSIYTVKGYLINRNPIEALDVKIIVTTYDSNGKIYGVNETPYLNPKNLPARGKSYFYVNFSDPEKKIVRFKVEVLDAKGELI